ncbi:cupin domain-containing protein [Hymenobacter sp. DH14]|uniref:Cupin domain-containing protein n=1 Tax=Hymenobacter cyanobacteriorum TaxID=2926463 RepID=A0A9X1VGQ9_9BACT|nr:cupin domain-containing protein [Hymenobacter cyanobacteriorum]MCI1188442.1 cupin domain-containing protein [Hymenobacter cyanobacteriorum]
MSAEHIIRHLQLLPHPEGGYYRETYRAVPTVATPEGHTRNVSTAIYYLLENEDKSHFHRIKSDELWFFHQGQALEIVLLTDGQMYRIVLGNDLAAGAVPQAVIPANTWFAAHLPTGVGHALVSCTVAPGFDFLDFELAERAALIHEFPHLTELVMQFT